MDCAEDSSAAGRMRIVAWCLFLCGLLQLHSAQDINCTVTVTDDDQTTYNISGMSHASGVDASKCEYSWTDSGTGNGVIAHHKGANPDLVLSNTINTLVTSQCFDKIVFAENCVSEGSGYTAICTVNCTLFALQMDQKAKEISRSWIPAIVAVVIVLPVVVLLLVICYCKFRDKTPRICSCNQLGCIYTAVKTQNVDLKAARVEVGNE
ncbi:uncharacterized protein LOC122861982 isoform X2 [Siniperca chuatsi]|uniref:uncharacterized protein LOC122861982 isoform X2 n=1 Tax=Siniperca chuatsi TaxID=119488 RepID=UPI001CE093EA|nr:uncharacterized protein LOC122861982 isoform X2 [Siniperca chuatsi]